MKYQVVFKGDILEGRGRDQVKKRLAHALGINLAKAETLFSGRRIVIRKSADIETCKKIKKTFEKAGAVVCFAKAQKASPSQHPSPQKSTKPAKAPLVAPKKAQAPLPQERRLRSGNPEKERTNQPEAETISEKEQAKVSELDEVKKWVLLFSSAFLGFCLWNGVYKERYLVVFVIFSSFFQQILDAVRREAGEKASRKRADEHVKPIAGKKLWPDIIALLTNKRYHLRVVSHFWIWASQLFGFIIRISSHIQFSYTTHLRLFVCSLLFLHLFCHQALEMPSDQRLLIHMAMNPSYHPATRRAAFEKVADQKFLFAMAMNSACSKDIREAAFNKVTDQNLLANVAMDSRHSEYVRIEIAKKLTDQKLLAEIAMNSDSESVATAAIKNIVDQDFLAGIAMNPDYSSRIRQRATHHLTDQKLLTDIVKNSDDESICRIAMERMNFTDPSMLADAAINTRSAYLGRVAVARISDPNLLAKLFINIPDERIRKVAMGRLDIKDIADQHLLAEIAKIPEIANDPKYENICNMAAEKITDQDLLVEIAKDSDDEQVRKTAISKLDIGKIEDQELLTELAWSASDQNSKAAALERLVETKRLFTTERAMLDKMDTSNRRVREIPIRIVGQ